MTQMTPEGMNQGQPPAGRGRLQKAEGAITGPSYAIWTAGMATVVFNGHMPD